MKLLFVCGAGHVFGKEIITLSLIEGLRERGHEVRCITSTWGTSEFTNRLEDGGTQYTRMPLGFISRTVSSPTLRMNFDQLFKLPRLWSNFASYMRDFNPDVVIHTNFHHLALLYPLLDPRKTFFHVHDPFAAKGFYRRVFRLLNRRVRAFVTVSEFIRRSIVQFGVPEGKIFSVLNGITLDSGEANSQSEKPSTNGTVRIGIVGQVGEWKGHDDFLEALRELKESHSSFSGVIFGHGDTGYIQSLKAKIHDYDLGKEIHWGGFVKNPGEIFKSTDICVVPSRSEDPCPTVAIEAAHFGVPVIATRRGGLPELVLDGTTGYLVDANHPEQITAKLKLLIEDTGLRRRMAEAARRHASHHLTRERMVQEMEEVFDRVLQSG